MANSETPQPQRQALLDWMVENRQRSAYWLFGLGVLLALIPLWLGIRYRSDYLLVCLGTGILALIPVGAGVWQLLRAPGPLSEKDAVRMLILAMGGLSGLTLVTIAVTLASVWWATIIGGVKEWQGAEGWRLWVFLMVLLGGLALMFVSLQLGRSEERSNPLLRRLVYGYNAVLTGLLLVAILAFLNVLAFIHLPINQDWTTKSIYSLSSKSESILQSLDKPVNVEVIIAQKQGDTLRRVRALLDNCRSFTDKLLVDYLSPDIDRDRVARLTEKYKFIDREGILVVYGVEPKTDFQFISLETLWSSSGPAMMRPSEDRAFKGESELMSALNFLSQNKERPVIYFTQGNGELDINDSDAGREQGGGVLKSRLEGDIYTVKGVQLGPIEDNSSPVIKSAKVPDDAAIVVVAGPRRTVPPEMGKALREYMNKPAADASNWAAKGKVIVLLDVVLNSDRSALLRTGLEEFLAEYNLKANNDRILRVSRQPPLVPAYAFPDDTSRVQGPFTNAFADQSFLFYNARTVAGQMAAAPQAGRFRSQSLLWVHRRDYVWTESDLRADPLELANGIIRGTIKRAVPKEALVVSVAAMEAMGADPHAMLDPTDQKPRLILVGSAAMASNVLMSEDRAARNYDLFQSMLGWLRERPGSIGIEPKRQDMYMVNAVDVNFGRMIGLPALLMIVGIIGLGTGVWVVRRR